jgi:hypothetical protein
MKLLFFLIFSFFSFAEEKTTPFYYFVPPKNWDLVAPDKLPKGTVIAFVEKSHKPFKASINLGIEATSVSLERYIEISKKKILANRSNSWSSLGILTQPTWTGHLAQIDSKNGCGDVRSFQCIISYQSCIYVLTAVALKEDHTKNAPLFMEIFESFSFHKNAINSLKTSDLKKSFSEICQIPLTSWHSLRDSYPQESLASLFEKKDFQKKWLLFEKSLQKTFKSQGIFWQAQAAQELKISILSSST